MSCMDIIADWITERHPLDSRRRELLKFPQERGESMVQYSNRILDLADKCDLNDITHQEIMAMIFICGCRSPQFRKELWRHGVGVSWQFIRKEAQGWDHLLRCKEQNGNQALNVTKNPSQATNRSQAKTNAKTILRLKRKRQTHSSGGNADDAAAQYTP